MPRPVDYFPGPRPSSKTEWETLGAIYDDLRQFCLDKGISVQMKVVHDQLEFSCPEEFATELTELLSRPKMAVSAEPINVPFHLQWPWGDYSQE